MGITAAIIRAGLGDLTLALEMAGVEIAAAYEADKRAIKIHKANFDVPLYPFPPAEIDIKEFPQVDLLAARLHMSTFSRAIHGLQKEHDQTTHVLREILSQHRPRAFFLLVNSSAKNKEHFHEFLHEVAREGYQLQWKAFNVAQAVGVPVNEYLVCVVGTLYKTEKMFLIKEYGYPKPMMPEGCLQLGQPVDPWYFQIKPNDMPQYEATHRFFCWKGHSYEGVDQVRWNPWKVPLVRDVDQLRKLTHREIANLKGFPAEYVFLGGNKQWLYQNLMYAGNVHIVRYVAETIRDTLTESSWSLQKQVRGQQFEELFGHYLKNFVNKEPADEFVIKENIQETEISADFTLQHGSSDFYFEVKHFSGKIVPKSVIRAACEQCSSFRGIGTPILVLANEVPDQFKSQYLEEFGVFVWDVSNLLWLFDEFPDIKNEFVATLDYTIDHIEPTPPMPNIIRKTSKSRQEEPSWRERLRRITAGKDESQAQLYESVCTEILKYVLGDYLTLWETQKSSNGGLYRFDLCCKIKSGVNQDFFDTVKHYFNTKYIVFEFKNYSKKITQKEIYTTEKYLYEKALRKVAIIISRSGADDHALKAARGSLRETGKLILCFSDDELLAMADIKTHGEQEPAEFLAAALDDLLVHLEK